MRKMDPSFTMVVAGTEGSSRSLIWPRIPTRCTAYRCTLLLSHLQGRDLNQAYIITLSLRGNSGVCAARDILADH